MRKLVDKEFALCRKHEQLETVYRDLYGDITVDGNVVDWFIDI